MSCSTGRGDEGKAFLQKVANYLGESGGYTDVVGGNGQDWFINGNGESVKYVVPEPSTGIAFTLAMPAVLTLARIRVRRGS
jgi:hypothetical protein